MRKLIYGASGMPQPTIIRSLNDTKTELKNRGKTTDAVDDLIIKFGYAPKKKFKVVERKDCSCRESR